MSNETDIPRNATRSQLYEISQDIGVNPSANPTIGDIIADRFSRRDIVRGALGVAAIAATTGALALEQAKAQGLGAMGQAAATAAQSAGGASRYRFEEVEAKVEQNHAVAAGY